MTPAEIKRTNLYRTLAPCIVKKDREELARMLAIIPGTLTSGIDLEESNLRGAFVWAETPQGDHYWRELYDRLEFAGHTCW